MVRWVNVIKGSVEEALSGGGHERFRKVWEFLCCKNWNFVRYKIVENFWKSLKKKT